MQKAMLLITLLFTCIVIGIGYFTATVPIILWHGCYIGGAYTFEFKDQRGEPVMGVFLEITDAHDSRIDRFRLEHFDIDDPAHSDQNGLLAVRAADLNYGGSKRYLFFIIPLDNPTNDEPIVNWRFVKNGRTVFHTTYKDLSDEMLAGHPASRSLRKSIVVDH